MWNTDTNWFDVAIVMGLLALGNILFGHFEEHRPKWRRLLKAAIALAGTIGLAHFGLRWVFFALIGVMVVVAALIHAWWLPKHGINGWTGEPKEKYYELIGAHPAKPEQET